MSVEARADISIPAQAIIDEAGEKMQQLVMSQVALLDEASLFPEIKVGIDTRFGEDSTQERPMSYQSVGWSIYINGVYIYTSPRERWPYNTDLVLCSEGLFHCLSYGSRHSNDGEGKIAHWPSKKPASSQEWITDGVAAINVLESVRKGQYTRATKERYELAELIADIEHTSGWR